MTSSPLFLQRVTGSHDCAQTAWKRRQAALKGDFFSQIVEQRRQALAVFPGKVLLEPLAALLAERFLICGRG